METVAEARRRFFQRSGFPSDGGYDDVWAEASFGAYQYAVPNTRARAAALRVHDLHHLLTGYATDWRGESEISAWELGSGGAGRYGYAWFIALFGLAIGLLTMPQTMWRAFVRGHSTRNLYGLLSQSGLSLQQVLALPLATLREQLKVERPSPLATTLLFALVVPVALLFGGLALLLSPSLALLAWLRKPCDRSRCLLAT